ncbi:MAG: single-stranded DNA-binding protein [Succinivibrio sp.]
MARGVNKVILIGNLGEEPSYRTTNSNTAVVNISMVTNEVRRNIETGQTTELAEWHRVVMWGKLAEIAHQWLHKGSQIYIEGKLRTRSYTDKQGTKRTVTEIVADEMQMLGGPKSPSAGAGYVANDRIPDSTMQPMKAAEPMYAQNSSQVYAQAPSMNSTSQYTTSQMAPESFSQAPSQGFGSSPMSEPPIYDSPATTIDGNSDSDDDLPF